MCRTRRRGKGEAAGRAWPQILVSSFGCKGVFMHGYVYLGIAIAAEVVATSALKATNGFTRLGPSVLVMLGYMLSFFLLGQVVKTVPVGVAYAIWSGLGIVCTGLIAYGLYGQKLDLPALLGMGLILAGALIIPLFSKSSA